MLSLVPHITRFLSGVDNRLLISCVTVTKLSLSAYPMREFYVRLLIVQLTPTEHQTLQRMKITLLLSQQP
ncbi:hypothetical protein [Terribacillus aidingensis]|uniref:hypothetical protein n=1 Tax=Terribacillus aidingensis TaxID=586416 RepID=UPI000BE395E3|nr:hypothetical protein [Terribacillus aidingensis]